MKFIIVSSLLFLFFILDKSNTQDSKESLGPDEDDDSSHIHPYGSPVSVLKFGDNGSFIVDNDMLNKMFNNAEVKDRKIVAVSIIGAFRKGKSFLMDYALRYMYAHYKSIAHQENPLNNTDNWMGEEEEILRGFSWKKGIERDTNGVIMWSDIFLHETPKNEKLAIVLMDTQGLFDTKTSPTDNSRIFALGTLASSVQIFNLNDVIQENQLEYLHLATEFSQFAMKKSKEYKKKSKDFKPFQKLIFLMRDWQNKQDFPFGEVGGATYLADVLQDKTDQPESLRKVREFMRKSFTKIDCFLMPHPGPTVTTDSSYEGHRGGLDDEFEEYLQIFLTYVLQPKALISKQILNVDVTGSDYAEYLKAYFEVFESDEIPKVETLHTITINKQMGILVAEALKLFIDGLKIPDYESENFLDEINETGSSANKTALDSFKNKRKLGSAADERKFAAELINSIEDHFSEWKQFHIKAYEDMKKMKEEAEKQVREAEQKAQEAIKEQQTKDDLELEQLKIEHDDKLKEMNETIDALKTESEQNIKAEKEQYEAQKNQTEKDTQVILEQYANANEEMKKKMNESQEIYRVEMAKSEEKSAQRIKEIEKMIDDDQEAKLLALKDEFERKKVEFEQQAKIQERKHQAELEQIKWEQKMKMEQKQIYDDAITEREKQLKIQIKDLKEEQTNLRRTLLTSLSTS